MPTSPEQTHTPAHADGASRPGSLDDLIDLSDESPAANHAAGKEDSIVTRNNQLLENAQAFEHQVEQLTTWKHQLASQMELLRKDGVKMLERQKHLAVERAALATEQQAAQRERQAVEDQRQQLDAVRQDLNARNQELDRRAIDLEKATEEFNKLLDQKERYLHESAEAQRNLEALRARQEQAGQQLQEFGKQADEITRLEAQKDQWLAQIRDAKATLDQLAQTQQEIAAHQQEFALRKAEFSAREKALDEREALALRQKVLLSDSLNEIETQRKTLVESELAIAGRQKDFQAQVVAHQAKVNLFERQSAEFASRTQDAQATQAQQAKLADEIQLLRGRLGDLQAQAAKADAAAAELRAGWASQQAAAQETVARKEQEIAELQQQLQAAAAQDTALARAQAQCRDLNSQVTALETQATEFKAIRETLETQTRDLRKQLADSSAFTNELRTDLAALQTAAQQAAARNQQEIATLQEAAHHAKQALASNQQEVTTLRETSELTLGQKEQQIAALEQRLQMAAENEQALAQAQAQCADLTAQLATLGRQAQELQTHRAALENQSEQLRNQLESQLAQATREKEETDHQLAARAAQTAALEEQLQEATEKLATASTQAEALEQAQRQHAALTEQLALAERHAQTLQAAHAQLEAQVAELQVQLLEQADSAELNNRLAEQKRRYEALVAGKQNQIAELQRLVELIQSQSRETGERSQDVLEYQRQSSRISQQLAQARQEVQALRDSRHEIQQSLEQLQASHAQAMQDASELRQTIENHKAAQEAAIAEIQRAHQEQLAEERAAAQSRLEAATADTDVQAQLEEQLAQYKAGFAARLRELQESYEAKIAQERSIAEENLAQARAAVPAATTAAPPPDFEKTIAAWQERAAELQTERDTLLGQRVDLEEASTREAAQAQQSQAELNHIIEELRQRCEALQAEKASLEQQPVATQGNGSAPNAAPSGVFSRQRERLLERIRKQRHRTWAYREAQRRLEAQWTDIAKQRESLKSRHNSLEQVKRLLEKQELIMARKLADHSAVKTVAAVGIFVIMILGAAFFGVYQFVSPTYQSEALVTLPANPLNAAAAADPDAVLRSDSVVNNAWDHLANDGHYNVQTERDAFAATLPANLEVQVNAATRRVAIRYSGPSSDGVAQVCNQMAMAYARALIEPAETRLVPAGETARLNALITFAVPPSTPIRDTRVRTFLTISAAALFASLILVMLMRVYIYRQLREIDRMADEEDLDNLKGEMPLDAPST